MTEIRWHGRGGLGAFTAARLLGCAVSLYEGKYALAFPSFGPERRGAPVFAFTRIDNKPITDRSEVVECDIAIVLDDTLFGDPVRNGLKPGATVIVNTTRDKAEFAIEGCNVVAVDATGLALEILGRPIPDGSWNGLLTENDAICQLSYAKGAVARFAYKILKHLKDKSEKKGKPDLNILFIYNMPFRAIGKMTEGLVSDKMVEDILFIVNGHFWRGLGRTIADFFRNKRAVKEFEKAM